MTSVFFFETAHIVLEELHGVAVGATAGRSIYWDNGKENGNYYSGVMKGLGFRV